MYSDIFIIYTVVYKHCVYAIIGYTFFWSLKQKKIWLNITALMFVFVASGLIIVQQYEDYARFTDCISKGFNYNAFSEECSLGL